MAVWPRRAAQKVHAFTKGPKRPACQTGGWLMKMPQIRLHMVGGGTLDDSVSEAFGA